MGYPALNREPASSPKLLPFRTHGDWVKETALQTADASRKVLALIESGRRQIEQLGRPASSVLRLHQHLYRQPIIVIPATAEQLSFSAPTVAKALEHMVKLGVVRETTGRQRRRLFTYRRYLDILNQGTEVARPGC